MPFPCSQAGSTTSPGSGENCYGGNKLGRGGGLFIARPNRPPAASPGGKGGMWGNPGTTRRLGCDSAEGGWGGGGGRSGGGGRGRGAPGGGGRRAPRVRPADRGRP